MSRMMIAPANGSIGSTPSKDMVFDSNLDYMLILSERTDISDGSGVLEITHGLGYIPSFYHFESADGLTWYRPTYSGTGGAYADTNKIYINTYDPNIHVRTIIWANSQDNSDGGTKNNAFGNLLIAKDGYDVLEETDLRRFKFASSAGILKIKEKRTITVSGTGDGTFTNTYYHGLGYVPQVYVFVGGIQIPTFYSQGGGMALSYSFEVDSYKITCTVFTSLGEPTTSVDFNIQIMLDKIA
jgi:hypothetical protein